MHAERVVIQAERLGSLTAGQLQRALDRFGLGRLTDVAPAVGGSFGQVILLTSDTGEWVLKGAPLVPWQLRAEAYFTELLHRKTAVPVPWPYRVDEADDIFGWSYALMSKLPGVDLGDEAVWAQFTPTESATIARSMGQTLADIAAVTAPVAARYDGATGQMTPYAIPLDEAVITEIADVLVKTRQQHPRRMPDADARWVEGLIERGREALRGTGTPRLTMQDFKDQNLMAVACPEGWRVGGVFDLGGLHFGDPAFGLCRQISQFMTRETTGIDEVVTFIDAFVAALDEDRQGVLARLPVYMLLERIEIWEWAMRERRPWLYDLDCTFREWAAPSIGAIEQVT